MSLPWDVGRLIVVGWRAGKGRVPVPDRRGGAQGRRAVPMVGHQSEISRSSPDRVELEHLSPDAHSQGKHNVDYLTD